MILDAWTAKGRVIAAGRMMAGVDQAALANEAGVSAATISNLERGNEVRIETLRSARRALKTMGVTVHFDGANGMGFAAFHFEEESDDDDDE